ncbi:START domain-containing protein [Hyalangium rubrum]|uniref:START domain-containing protein n=1 Tax=Hyalangium rubrum TaxID=3103134 RepID=A0ABU5H9G8_9BACT|nr:START domain-containing protein [Hyalangium sp. s54d21]MDY7230119.1 START domain-containing protein [Hyalangium sp. s54d21]
MSNVKRLWWCGALAVALVGGVASAEEKWETVEDDDVVIKVRARSSGVGKEVWAEGDLEANAYDIQTALIDAGSFRLWMPYVKESRIVSTAEDGSRMAYAKLNFPVVSARDYVLHVVDEKKIAEDGTGEFVQRWTSADAVVPVREGVVRLKHNDGTWHVTPKGEGKAHVVYKFSVDPGGSVPGWLASFGQKDGVMDTFEAVEERAQKLGKERQKAKPAPAKP